MPKTRNIYTCTECAYETGKWLGKCPMCNNFNTFEESVIDTKKEARKFVASSSKVFGVNEISTMPDFKTPTKIGELDRVLSGGIVAGSLILIGGDPGIGKSTLILQICQTLGEQNKKILYVSGEESINQIKLRADRLNVTTENLFLLAETDLDIIQN
ncbi:MAG: AAA family ATPase, partial [Defluviitaleaceae bacterium]|nr:AAA family ATPase [Defluviitaleaceae bacterium]